jgi:hypothetical protein
LSRRAAIVPACAAGVVLALASAATVWSAWSLRGPLGEEFGWSAASLTIVGVLSLAVSAALWPWSCRLVCRFGVRATVTLGCLAAGLILLLALPNLTHLWQLGASLALLSMPRALVLAGGWRQLRHLLRRVPALLALLAALLTGLAGVTPWISEIVYRNSWREGVAACAGLLFLIATPLAYVLLPGREQRCAGPRRARAKPVERAD